MQISVTNTKVDAYSVEGTITHNSDQYGFWAIFENDGYGNPELVSIEYPSENKTGDVPEKVREKVREFLVNKNFIL